MLEYYLARLIKKLQLSAKKDHYVHPTSKVEAGSQFVNSTMSKHSFCGYNCKIIGCEIGSFCSIADGVVMGVGQHPLDWVATSPVFYAGRDSVNAKFSEHKRVSNKKITVGHDVWIGENVLVKQGVIIGTGSVIGMGSIVTKDVPPYCIVAGNPARLIRKRFDDEIIKRLLETEWWNSEEGKLAECAKHIKNASEFLNCLER